jgi:hypothetical protein
MWPDTTATLFEVSNYAFPFIILHYRILFVMNCNTVCYEL